MLIQGNDFSIIATTANGPKPPRDTYTVKFKTELKGITAFRLEALTFEELPKGGPGRDPQGGFVVSEIAVLDGAGRPVRLRNATASTTAPVKDESLSGRPRPSTAGWTAGGWALAAADGNNHRLVMETTEPVGAGGETAFTVVIRQERGPGPDPRPLPHVRLVRGLAGAHRAGPRSLEGDPGYRGQAAGRADARSRRTGSRASTAGSPPSCAPLRPALRAAELRKADAPRRASPSRWSRRRRSRTPCASSPAATGRTSRARSWSRRPRISCPRSARPAAAPRASTSRAGSPRKENPLTARVFVNRLWKVYFGQGLTRTLEDLGSQGEWPTHPELLDWLAVEFVESGWDVKHMVRTLVTSATYRQTSRVTPRPAGARSLQPPLRPPVALPARRRARPRQRAGRQRPPLDRAWAARAPTPTSPRATGPTSTSRRGSGTTTPGDDQYRRGVYTWWQRTFPQPSLARLRRARAARSAWPSAPAPTCPSRPWCS